MKLMLRPKEIIFFKDMGLKYKVKLMRIMETIQINMKWLLKIFLVVLILPNMSNIALSCENIDKNIILKIGMATFYTQELATEIHSYNSSIIFSETNKKIVTDVLFDFLLNRREYSINLDSVMFNFNSAQLKVFRYSCYGYAEKSKKKSNFREIVQFEHSYTMFYAVSDLCQIIFLNEIKYNNLQSYIQNYFELTDANNNDIIEFCRLNLYIKDINEKSSLINLPNKPPQFELKNYLPKFEQLDNENYKVTIYSKFKDSKQLKIHNIKISVDGTIEYSTEAL